MTKSEGLYAGLDEERLVEAMGIAGALASCRTQQYAAQLICAYRDLVPPQGPFKWQDILDELMAMRMRLDQIAAVVMGRQAREELGVQLWSCGHRHATRKEAIDCLNTSPKRMEQTAEARTLAP